MKIGRANVVDLIPVLVGLGGFGVIIASVEKDSIGLAILGLVMIAMWMVIDGIKGWGK